MKQRLVIEVEGREEAIKEMVANIEAAAIGQIGAKQARGEVTGYSYHKEMLPERGSGGVQIPDFLKGRGMAYNG